MRAIWEFGTKFSYFLFTIVYLCRFMQCLLTFNAIEIFNVSSVVLCCFLFFLMGCRSNYLMRSVSKRRKWLERDIDWSFLVVGYLPFLSIQDFWCVMIFITKTQWNKGINFHGIYSSAMNNLIRFALNFP